MQLESIQIYGFKSFADKTTINFPTGVTGIVGPNGSGKSNITEAVRWVLGEQSAKSLRGNKMPDIIFSGSEKRRSLNYATVSLLFNNSDQYIENTFNELKITRKLFKNGDSTYLINDRECRLKDITSLFMDTGLGEGNLSIISQGNVEKIINSNALERRSIIENVAGIYKYKQQKQIANKNILSTKDNLSRINDIISEVGSRLDPLKQQQQLAKEYLNQTSKLEHLNKIKLILTSQQLINEIDVQENSIKDKSDKLSELEVSLDNLQTRKSNLKQELLASRNLLDDKQAILLKLSNQIKDAENKLALLKQKSNFKTQDLERMHQDLDSLKSKQANLVLNLSEIDSQIELAKKKIADHQKDIESPKIGISVEDINREIADLRNKYVELIKQQTKLSNQIEHQQQNERYLENYQVSNKHVRQEVANLEDEIKLSEKRLKNVLNQKSSKQARLSDIDTQISQIKLQLNQVRSNWLEASKVLEQAKIKLTNLREIHDSFQVFYQGVSNLLKNKAKFEGIIGPVADEIKIDGKYLTAIEIALGNQAQNVIVKDELVAKNIIRYLSNNKLGRVTLLPLTTIKEKSIFVDKRKIISKVPGYVGIANELIKLDKKLISVGKFLLGNVIIADNLDSANAIGKAINYQNRIVTLDGQVVNVGGSMTGGNVRSNQQGILSQKQEIDNLVNSISKMEQLLIEKESLVKQDQSKLDETTTERQKVLSSISELTITINQLNKEISFNSVRLSKLKEQLAKQVHDKLDELSSDELSVKLAEVDQQIVEIDQQIIDKDNELSQVKLINQETQNDLLVVKHDLASYQDNKSVIQRDLELIEQQVNQLINNIRNNKSTNIQEINALNDMIQELINSKNDEFNNIKNIKENIVDFENNLDKIDKILQDTQTNVLLSKQAVQSLTGEFNQSKELLNKNFAKLLSDYGLSQEDVHEFDDKEYDLEETLVHIRLINQSIDELGTVNINSIDEYQSVNERYNFLCQQRDDLLKANEQLEQSMKTMNHTISTKFKDAFDQVSGNFSKTFKAMFGGGKAELVLTDPDNILDSGIEIMAMPPGKSLRDLSLLSGGEKALTAISLLFAILKVKPVPFCILDEAEASLDPANVDRFANYLTQLDDQTQFIVITHRKETMKYADQLYGVTMQESGVSKVVTVKLKNLIQGVE